jgi:hypothetical protein
MCDVGKRPHDAQMKIKTERHENKFDVMFSKSTRTYHVVVVMFSKITRKYYAWVYEAKINC